MSSARPDIDVILANTSFSAPGELELADRTSLVLTRALRFRIEKTLSTEPTPARTLPSPVPVVQSIESPVAATAKPDGRKMVRGRVFDVINSAAVPIQVTETPRFEAEWAQKGLFGRPEVGHNAWQERAAPGTAPAGAAFGGPIPSGEVADFKRWLRISLQKNVPSAIVKARGTRRKQLEELLRLRRARLRICGHMVRLYESDPVGFAPLFDVVRVVRARDVFPTDSSLLVVLSACAEQKQQNAALQVLFEAACPNGRWDERSFAELADSFLRVCEDPSTRSPGLRALNVNKPGPSPLPGLGEIVRKDERDARGVFHSKPESHLQ